MNTIIEKLKAEIERRMRICERVRGEGGENQDYYHGKAVSYNETLTFLSDLEKECGDFPTTDEEMKQFLATHPKVEAPDRYKTPDWMFDGLTPEEKMNHPLYLEGFEVGRKVGLVLAEKTTIPAEGFDREFSKFSNDVDAEHPFPICVDEFKDFARHFYELGRQSKPKVCEELEEEITKFTGEIITGVNPIYTESTAKHIVDKTARHFAQWQKEQMMKEAVGGFPRRYEIISEDINSEGIRTYTIKEIKEGEK